MLQDRPYMRGGPGAPRTSALTWLISSLVAMFIVQNVCTHWLGNGYLLDAELGLSSGALRSGRIWTLLTYGFLHDTGNLLQIITYVAVLHFFGGEVLTILGTRRFVSVYLVSTAVGGACWVAAHWGRPELLVGASAGASAVFILYACFFPNREISQLLFFFLPVRAKPKHLAYFLIGWDLCGLGLFEVMGAKPPFGAAHSARLAAMAVAWLYFRYIHDSSWSLSSDRADIEFPRWMKQRGPAKAAIEAPAFSVNIGDRGHLRAEVDRILDKINSDGFASLSADERRVLDEARDLITRR